MSAEEITPLLAKIDAAAQAAWLDRGAAKAALIDCERALKRIAKRAETLSGEFERVEIAQTHGATIEFTGRRLCQTQFEGRGGTIGLEIWESQGGALIVVEEAPDRRDESVIRCAVVEPCEDHQAMRFAVMEFFNWTPRARRMVRDLGWSLRQEIE